MQTIEVSIDVMWEFVSNQMSKDEFVKWWKDSLSTSGKKRNQWQMKAIQEKPAEQWDVSILCYAILNCGVLKFNASQKDSVMKLRDIRNVYIFHRRVGEMNFGEYVKVLNESMKSYEGLLGEDWQLYVKQLEDINNCETFIKT